VASIRFYCPSRRSLTASAAVSPARFPKRQRGIRRGFTLIELLVVVLILGILTATAIPLFLSSVRAASAQTVHANLRSIGQAGRAYYLKYGQYPTSIDDLVGTGKDIEHISGPRGVTYDIDVSAPGGGAGSGNGKGNNGKGNGTGAPGNGKGQGNPGGGNGNSGGGGTGAPEGSTCVIRATENGADTFGSTATDDTATLTLPDSSYSGL
jgi:prepilin-type N-terminal cleavage/methylation domain-containing protein